MKTENTKLIAKQNDLFRSKLGVLSQEIPLVKGHYLLTAGFFGLESRDQISVLSNLRSFKNFNHENDPYGEHDFGKFRVKNHQIIWKIDYYDIEYKYGSPEPSNPNKTRRVLTLMLASEY